MLDTPLFSQLISFINLYLSSSLSHAGGVSHSYLSSSSLTFSYKIHFLFNAIFLYSRFTYLLDIINSSLDSFKPSRSIFSRFPGYVRVTHKLPLLYTFFLNSIQSQHTTRPPWYSLFCDYRLNFLFLIAQYSKLKSVRRC